MDPSSIADLIVQSPGRALIVIAVQLALFLLAALHRHLSNVVGNRVQPQPGERWYALWMVLGFISGAVWKNAEGSVKPILSPMPTAVLTPQGGRRSGGTPPQGTSGTYARIDPPPTPTNIPPLLLVGFLFALGAVSACGPSTYLKKMKATEGVQEESVKRQAEETDKLLKSAWFLCNKWSDRAHHGAQNVLLWRAEVAKGTAGAVESQAKAESWADKVLKVMGWHCEVANDTSLLLKGVPLDPPTPAPTGTPDGPPPVVPSAPAAPGPPARPTVPTTPPASGGPPAVPPSPLPAVP